MPIRKIHVQHMFLRGLSVLSQNPVERISRLNLYGFSQERNLGEKVRLSAYFLFDDCFIVSLASYSRKVSTAEVIIMPLGVRFLGLGNSFSAAHHFGQSVLMVYFLCLVTFDY